ncbi:hypothetical protein [Luteolibacter sp. Populi]|uniref:hypothetical protein n=1 Tax=Luteolibacter sp. Populi TaxID=3230487 RepID=UPI003467D110
MNEKTPNDEISKQPDLNPDPITGEPGSHPVGTGIGAAGGAAGGAVIGAAGGPIGVVVGAIIGGVVGGLAGKGVAENIDPTAEEAYWKENYQREPYYAEDKDFADYGPAYQMSMARYSPDSTFEDEEPVMADEWDATKGSSRLHWLEARAAAKAGWDRLHHHSKVKEEVPV